MVATTTQIIEGHKIVKYKKVLTEYEFAGGKLGCREGETPKSVNEMTREEFEKAFADATSAAFSKLVAHAKDLNANAVIGADTEYKFCGPENETLMVIAKGTAVIVDVSYY